MLKLQQMSFGIAYHSPYTLVNNRLFIPFSKNKLCVTTIFRKFAA